MQYSLVGNEDGTSNITVFARGRVELAHSSHPNFERIVLGVLDDDESVLELFDVSLTVATRFDNLSERVSVANGRVYFDGVEVDNALTSQILRFLDEDVEDWYPLVNFFENVQQNPQEYSREQLFSWLDKRDFTITPGGMIVGYKGVKKNDDGTFTSISTGTAIVDGESKTGAIPNEIGSEVTMPRDQVAFDPSTGCSTGLHVGTYEYANGFADGALLEVHVNPRDVVSVPEDSSFQKMRVCRYRVVNVIDAPHTLSVVSDWYDDSEDVYDTEDETCPDCGCYLDRNYFCDCCDSYR